MAWFVSDNHFNHENIIKYCERPFENKEEMDKYMIERWNSVVGEDDLVYHLGDFALGLTNEEYEDLLKKLNGKIVLIYGNHDRKGVGFFKSIGFLDVYKKSTIVDRYILTHRPIEAERIPEGMINIHGHIHNYPYPEGIDTSRYINVSVEMIDYVPTWIDVSSD